MRGLGQFLKHHGRAFEVGYLTGAELEDDWSSGLVAHGVELGVQSDVGASDMAGNIPFLEGSLQCDEP